MEYLTLNTKIRMATGKSAMRQLRINNRIPGIFYGKSRQPVMLSLAPEDLDKIYTSEMGANCLVQLDLDKEQPVAMLKDIQVHPLTRKYLHADFIEINVDEMLTVTVPLVTTGIAIGVTNGGNLHQVFRQLTISCLPTDIPQKIEVDITHLDINDTVKVKDLPLTENVKVLSDPHQTVILVAGADAEEKEPDEGVEGELTEASTEVGDTEEPEKSA